MRLARIPFGVLTEKLTKARESRLRFCLAASHSSGRIPALAGIIPPQRPKKKQNLYRDFSGVFSLF